MVTGRRESKERQKKINQAIAKRAKDRGLPSDLIRYQIAFEGFLERVFQTGSDEGSGFTSCAVKPAPSADPV